VVDRRPTAIIIVIYITHIDAGIEATACASLQLLTYHTSIFKEYKSVRNKVRNETRNLQREEQRQVAFQCKENPKVFWKYINIKQ